MPRYQYRCTECEVVSLVHHLSDEVVSACPQCDAPDALVKMLTSFRTNPSTPVATKQKTGQVTEEFIKDSREDLKQYRKELENKS